MLEEVLYVFLIVIWLSGFCNIWICLIIYITLGLLLSRLENLAKQECIDLDLERFEIEIQPVVIDEGPQGPFSI